MYDQHEALHHLDVPRGDWIYRVFLLPGTLQVDLAFVAVSNFRALAPTFRLVFGQASAPQHTAPASAEGVIGLGWLYALHARSCIARRRLWQAEYMVSGLRDTVLTLACIRHGLPTQYGRGIDQLPGSVTAPLENSLIRPLGSTELSCAFRIVLAGFQQEIESTNRALAERLKRTLDELLIPES
jgi:hypothetical protein